MKPRLYVIDVPCSECSVGAGAQCVRPNGRPFSRLVGGMFDEPGPGLFRQTFKHRDGREGVYYSRPYQYHQPRRLLFRTVLATMILGRAPVA